MSPEYRKRSGATLLHYHFNPTDQKWTCLFFLRTAGNVVSFSITVYLQRSFLKIAHSGSSPLQSSQFCPPSLFFSASHLAQHFSEQVVSGLPQFSSGCFAVSVIGSCLIDPKANRGYFASLSAYFMVALDSKPTIVGVDRQIREELVVIEAVEVVGSLFIRRVAALVGAIVQVRGLLSPTRRVVVERPAAVVRGRSESFASDGGQRGYQGSMPNAFESAKLVVDCGQA